jgi:hypothetical protein
MSFGVPVKYFPVADDGQLKTENLKKWIARRKVKEAALELLQVFNGIDLPGLEDVVAGQGKPFREHSGNVRMISLVVSCFEEFEKANKSDKMKITWKVLNAIKQAHGRFLERGSDGWWYEVCDTVAREKVGICFRSVRASHLRQRSTQTISEEPRGKRARIEQQHSGQCLPFCH